MIYHIAHCAGEAYDEMDEPVKRQVYDDMGMHCHKSGCVRKGTV